MTTIGKNIGRAGAVLLAAWIATEAFAEQGLGVEIADDGAVDAARQCDVYITGVATGTSPEPLRYRWLEGGIEVLPWNDVRADRTAPLDLCDLGIGRHALTLEVTDGKRTVSDTMVATIATPPALIARGGRASSDRE